SVDKSFTRQDGRSCNRDILFRFRSLEDVDLAAVPQQRLLDHARIGKLVRERPRAIGLFFQQIFDHARMSPPEQFVQIAELLVKLVVSLRTNQHRLDRTVRTLANGLSKRADPRIRADSLAVLYSGLEKFAGNFMVDINACNHQRSKKIALSALIHAEVRLEHFRRVHFFIAQLCFAENLRLQLKLHELLHAPALHEHLRSFLINRDAEPVLLCKKKRVFLWRKFEPELFEQYAKLRRLS